MPSSVLLILLTRVIYSSSTIIPAPTLLSGVPNHDFEHCHTIIFEGITKELPNKQTQNVHAAWNKIAAVRISADVPEKLIYRSDTDFYGFASFDDILTTLMRKWYRRKETCQVLYILNPASGEDYCNLKSSFKWLAECNDEKEEEGVCYGRHLYFIWVRTIHIIHAPKNPNINVPHSIFRDDPYLWRCKSLSKLVTRRLNFQHEYSIWVPFDIEYVPMHEYVIVAEPPRCVDNSPQCPALAARGECQTNQESMLQSCRSSCKTCGIKTFKLIHTTS